MMPTTEQQPRERPVPTLPSEADLNLMLLIRHFENGLLDLFEQGLLNGTTHTCLGQEYIPVALCSLLNGQDYVFSNHRGHGHYLARFDDPAGLLAEIMGRAGAVCAGVGGSQHIYRERYLSTGVQGQSLPVAAGVALRLRRDGDAGLAVAFVGDGTWGEGSVYEALNMAALWRLPLLVVVENNGIAQTTPTAITMAGTIRDRAAAFGVSHQRVSGVDVNRIRAELAPLVADARTNSRPWVIEFDTHRLGPHSKGDDTRPADAIRLAREHDWYPLYASAFGDRFAAADRRQRERVAGVIADVTGRPESTWEQPCGW